MTAPTYGVLLPLATTLLAALQASTPAPQVRAPSALYLGKTLTTPFGRTFHAFSGIRYAKPSTGVHKFNEPKMMDDVPDGMVVLAQKEGPECVQIYPLVPKDKVVGSEDCLFLNVYTPNITVPGAMSVMVFIHGGGWETGGGGSQMYGPEYIMDKHVVLVTINYRLGPIGFSSLEDDVLPGNLGLRDQRLALKWVQKNIRAFGGDPDQVTLFGQSVGAASVHYHMMSPNSKGLFHRCISQSGTALGPWALAQAAVMKNRTLLLADLLKCPGYPSEKVLDCLKGLRGEQIVNAMLDFDMYDRHVNLFRPVVEKSSDGVVIEDPWAAEPASLPWMLGTTSSEAGYITELIGEHSGPFLDFVDASYELIGPLILMYHDISPEPLRVAKAVRTHYLKGNRISMENIQSVIEMLSDAWFTYPGYESARRHNGTVYSYYFDHKGKENIAKVLQSEEHGVSHGEEIPYIFNNSYVKILEKGSEIDKLIANEMTQLWTNFAKTGDPNPPTGRFQWLPWTSSQRNTLHITSSGFANEKDILGDRIKFWETLPVHYQKTRH